MKKVNDPFLNKTVQWLFLFLLAIFPISNTIALRNLVLVLLSGTMLILLIFRPIAFSIPLRNSLRTLHWPILFWTGFLFLFPLWATESATAWSSLGNEWVAALLAGFVGYSVFHLLGPKGPGLLALGYASAVPLLLHLLLCIAAMFGLLDNAFFADPSLGTLWGSLLHPEAFRVNMHLTWQDLMHGFRGLEPMHGNLGYPACQTIAMFSAYLVTTPRVRNLQKHFLCVVGIALCFMSILIVQSRGAILYAFLVLALGCLLAKLRFITAAIIPTALHKTEGAWRMRAFGLVAAVVLLTVT